MCNWNTYTFDCGCFEVRLRDRCQTKLADDDMDPCLKMQRVKEEWRYHQGTLCAGCERRERETGSEVARAKNGAVAWSVVSSRVHAEAIRLAQSRSCET